MNDFTKEELETIENRLQRTQLISNDPLVNKVQSMIDNYCEHEKTEWVRDAMLVCENCRKEM